MWRISVGGALARAAWGGFIRAARALAETGRFDAFADAAPHAEQNLFFADDFSKHRLRFNELRPKLCSMHINRNVEDYNKKLEEDRAAGERSLSLIEQA